jgi:hypothetical protein
MPQRNGAVAANENYYQLEDDTKVWFLIQLIVRFLPLLPDPLFA